MGHDDVDPIARCACMSHIFWADVNGVQVVVPAIKLGHHAIMQRLRSFYKSATEQLV